MKVLSFDQRTEEWFESRRGLITGSQAVNIITPTGKKSTKIKNMALIKADEIKYGIVKNTTTSEAMQRGVDLEPEAFDMAVIETGIEFKEVGFIDPEDGISGVSPDGICFDRKIGLEIKCKMSKGYCEDVIRENIDPKYIPQVQFAMMVTGFSKWIYYSYYPMRPSMCVEVPRDDEYIDLMRQYLLEFRDMRDDFLRKLS